MDEQIAEPNVSATEQAEAGAHGHDGEPPAIDIEALAERVYRLMLAEIRLDRARGLASDTGG
jgi:hypothetical protein